MNIQPNSFNVYKTISIHLKYPFFWTYLLILHFKFYSRFPKLIIIDFILFLARICFYFVTFLQTIFSLKGNKRSSEFTYGELSYHGLESIYQTLNLDPNLTIVDLGSGCGKVLFYSSLKYQVKSVGVDINGFYTYFTKLISSLLFIPVSCHCQNFLKDPLPPGDIVFVPTTCLSENTIQTLSNHISNSYPRNTIIISTSIALPTNQFLLTNRIRVIFSWGYGHIYVHKLI
ncbi:hypothetical protein DID75_01545 [Candidatus Marinamargulisbacteria bacterium SCGC AG-410-N11]|nr:hypothetical protein DID75_01545 [Candidatus Marinamargulisbacteria bacterium SCGC AG-410-N11]